MNHTKYDKISQKEWVNSESWETKRASELPITLLAIALCVFGFFLLNGIADWVCGL